MFNFKCLILIAISGFAQAAQPVDLFVWPMKSGFWESRLTEFEAQTGVSVELHVIPYPYSRNIEQELIHNPDVDVVALANSSLGRVREGGWLYDLSVYPEAVEAVNAHFSSVKTALYGEHELSGIGAFLEVNNVPMFNLPEYLALGYSGDELAASWPELYDQVLDSARRGHRNFFSPNWIDSDFGIALAFIAEIGNRGGRLLEESGGRLLDKKKREVAVQVLEDWRRVWMSGAVHPSILKKSILEQYTDFREQRIAIAVLSTYALKLLGELDSSQEVQIALPAVGAKKWGTLQFTLFAIADKTMSEQRRRDALLLVLWLTRGAEQQLHDGQFSANKKFMNSDPVVALLEDSLPSTIEPLELLDLMSQASPTSDFWNVQWHGEFLTELRLALQDYLNNENYSVDQVFQRLEDSNERLRSEYGY